MTAYVSCKECGSDVPWYYAWLYGSDAMHPGCARQRIDEEGCGAVWSEISGHRASFKDADSIKKGSE
jgi:hypothetical protein